MKRFLLLICGMSAVILGAQGAALMTSENKSAESWSLIEGPDGKIWSITTKSDMVNLGNEYYDDLRYSKMTVTVCNAEHEEQGSFTIDVTGLNANSMELFGPLTQHLFNADDQYELGIEMHIPGSAANGYQGQTLFRAYSLDGSMLMEAEGSAVIEENGDNSCVVLNRLEDDGMWGKTVLDVYQRNADGESAELVHSFVFDRMLSEYMNAPILSMTKMEDGIHYILGHYEKPLPLMDKNGEIVYNPITWMPEWTPDNNFVIEHYNQNFEQIDVVYASTATPQGLMLRMMGIGVFGGIDVTKGYFTGDDRYNYVITCEDTTEEWNSEYAFEVYAQGSEKVGTLCNHVQNFWKHLSPIEGEADQWVFLNSNAETYEQQLSIIEIPSFQEVATIPSTLDGKLISANIDRVADAAEGYKYIIGINEADTDKQGNVISQYGFYHKDLSIDHYVSFNMGPTAETFTPLVNSESLDPHLFSTDDKREFLFLAKLKGDNGEMNNTLFLGNEDGEILKTWNGDGTDWGQLQQVAILNYGTEQAELFLSYYDWDNDTYHNEFFALPLFSTTSIQQIGNASQNALFYNLQGQRINHMQKGIAIRNRQIIVNK